jgi:peptidyl-prolyl cis-trans isomerase SurA
MPKKVHFRTLFLGAACIALSVFAAPMVESSAWAASSAISAIVDGTVITSSDVAKRVAFLRLRRVGGNAPSKARQELIDEALMRAEIIRTHNSVDTNDVDAAFARFAAGNKLSVDQLTKIVNQAGVTAEHFKAYIGIQMSWPRVVQARFGGGARMTNDDLVTRLKSDNGKKPTTTEYILQQVIFVVPESKRAKLLGKRKSEAEVSRKSYPGCDKAKVFAAGYRDVSIRELGRILAPQLPGDWKALIEKTEQGGTTGTRATERGVEYLAVCVKREVSDDFAAQIVYQAKDLQTAEKDGEDPNSKKYLEELRKKAQIELH